MANCIDCLHFEVCQYDEQERAEANLEPSYRDLSKYIADGCKFFKNKSDFVEVKKAAEILDEAFGNDYPCNFNNIDEWLPYLCEYANTCDCSSVKCWEQLIKHYDERGADNG